MKTSVLVFLATHGPKWFRRLFYFRVFSASVLGPLSRVMQSLADSADATTRRLTEAVEAAPKERT